MKNFLRVLYILIFVIAGILVLFHPAKTETNILNAVFSNNSADKTVVELSGRYSSKINVIAESDDAQISAEAIEKFLEKTDKEFFTPKNTDVEKFLEKYKKFHNNLLSTRNINLLEREHYADVTLDSFENLYNPLSLTLLPLDEDPFLLFTDYIQSLSKNHTDYSSINYNDKYYSILTLEINADKALSPSIINKEIKKLIKNQKKLSVEGVKIYLTGTPIHSYYASSKSMFEINLICILSAIFLFTLFKLYFSNIKLIIPAAISLGSGMLAGYLATSLIFPSIHVLTFVFSTTLIGICIDYSLHYFIEKDLQKILKSLTISMITTVSAFAVLLFSGVELLKQISIFTMAGLFSVYSMVALFYPLLKLEGEGKSIAFEFPKNFRKIFLISTVVLALIGLFFIRFNDDIRNLYVPSKKLVKAEQLFKEITGNDAKTTFAIVRGEDFENLLENEEKLTKQLTDTDFQALSKFVPSKKQQRENQQLIKNLYENSLENYASFLTHGQINKLLNQKYSEEFLEIDKDDILSEFLLDDNTSIVVLYDIKDPHSITNLGYEHIDVQKDISDKISQCRKNCLLMLIPILIVLFGLLAVIYKPKKAIKILLPSIITCIFSIGLLSIFRVEINLFHILALFLIIGFGLDYSVFRASGLKGSKNAVLLSASTTIFSFLLLSFTSFKLISSLGLILTIGLIVSYLLSLIFEYKKEGN